jgi:hypothetical protein
MNKKPWLLKSQAEKNNEQAADHPGLLACAVYSAMQKNQELRDGVLKLQKNLDDAVELLTKMDQKIAILNVLNKPSNGKNPNASN